MSDLPSTGDAPPAAARLDPTPRFRPRQLPAQARPRRTLTRRSRRIMLVVGIILIGYLLFAAYEANKARQELSAGRALLDKAKVMTSDADIANARAVAPLRAGAADLDSAHRRLQEAAMEPLQFLPLIGRQLKSASALAEGGSRGANTVASALTGAHTLASTPPDPAGRVKFLEQFQTIVNTARLRLDNIGLGPNTGLLTRLAVARNDLSDGLTRVRIGLDRAVAASRAAINLFSGRHDVLLLLTNNAEMRAGSGMVNVLALMHIDDGRASIVSTVRVADAPVPPGKVAGPADYTARWGWLNPTTDWQELLASPRFDVTGALAEKMWEAAGHPAVPAVLAVDPFALQAILGATGPVQFGGRAIDASNVVDELLHRQYEQYPDADAAARHEELGALAQTSIARLDQGGWSGSTLALNLATVVRGRHLMIWAADPNDERAWQDAGAGGTLRSDSVMVSLLNRARDKGDYFVKTNAGFDTRVTATGTDVTMTMAIANNAPTTDVPYVIGPGIGVQGLVTSGTVTAGDYVGVLAVNLPRDATNINLDGTTAPEVFGPDGATVVIGQQYLIKHGDVLVAVVHFHLPRGERTLHLEPAARAPSLFWRITSKKFAPADAARTYAW